jgi:hypothetical protein
MTQAKKEQVAKTAIGTAQKNQKAEKTPMQSRTHKTLAANVVRASKLFKAANKSVTQLTDWIDAHSGNGGNKTRTAIRLEIVQALLGIHESHSDAPKADLDWLDKLIARFEPKSLDSSGEAVSNNMIDYKRQKLAHVKLDLAYAEGEHARATKALTDYVASLKG